MTVEEWVFIVGMGTIALIGLMLATAIILAARKPKGQVKP